MTNIYSTKPTDFTMNYGNGNSLRGIALSKILGSRSEINASGSAQAGFSDNFAQAIYANGPYNLLTPNNTTEQVAQNIDFLA